LQKYWSVEWYCHFEFFLVGIGGQKGAELDLVSEKGNRRLNFATASLGSTAQADSKFFLA